MMTNVEQLPRRVCMTPTAAPSAPDSAIPTSAVSGAGADPLIMPFLRSRKTPRPTFARRTPRRELGGPARWRCAASLPFCSLSLYISKLVRIHAPWVRPSAAAWAGGGDAATRCALNEAKPEGQSSLDATGEIHSHVGFRLMGVLVYDRKM